MIRRAFYFLLVTVLLGGLAGGIAFWSFYALPSFIAEGIKSAPQPVQTVSAEEAKTENWQPEICRYRHARSHRRESTSRRRSAVWSQKSCSSRVQA